MREGAVGMVQRFTQTRSSPSREHILGESTTTGDALMSLDIGLLIFGLASWLATGLHGPRLCVTPLRNFFSAYALTISIVFVTFLSHVLLNRGFTLDYLDVPNTDFSIGLPTRILVIRYSDFVHENYLLTHYPNGTTIPYDYLNASDPTIAQLLHAPHPDDYPPWYYLANNTKGAVQLDTTWWVGLPSNPIIYVWALLYSIPIVIFFLVDQIVSAGLAQPSELRLTKGRYYHSGLLLVGVLNFIGPLLGLPFVTGALPQSPELTIQMCETSDESAIRLEKELTELKAQYKAERHGSGGGASGKATTKRQSSGLVASLLGGGKEGGDDGGSSEAKEPTASDLDRRPLVIQSRLAPLLAYTFIFLALMVPSVINLIPAAAVEGTLIYIGLTGIFNTQLWQRIVLMLSDWRLYSPSMPFSAVKPARMHLYTIIQLLAIGIAWLIQALPPSVALIFPLWIISLVPLRIYAMPFLFTQEELSVLDAGSEKLATLIPSAQQSGANKVDEDTGLPPLVVETYGTLEKGASSSS